MGDSGRGDSGRGDSGRATVAGYLDIARRLIPELGEPYELDRIATRVALVWADGDTLTLHCGELLLGFGAERVAVAA